MNIFKIVAALSLQCLVCATAANAVSVKNLDETEYTLTVVEGASSQELSLKPGASVNGICLKGCLIKLSSDQDSYELEGGEVTSIESGVLWGDEITPPAAVSEVPSNGASTDKKP